MRREPDPPVPKDYQSRMTDKLKTTLEVGQLKPDNMSRMKETYAALAIEPDNVLYRWASCTSTVQVTPQTAWVFARDAGAARET